MCCTSQASDALRYRARTVCVSPMCLQVTTSMGRSDAKVVSYNAQALTSLTAAAAAAKAKLLVDDLYTAIDEKCGKNCASQAIRTTYAYIAICNALGPFVA